MANKITKREVITSMLQNEVVKANPTWVDYLTHEIELMDNKKANKKATATQVENEVIKARIVTALDQVGKPVTISELQGADANLAQYSTSKLSALMRQLVVDEGKVAKTTDKKRSLFSLIEVEEEVDTEEEVE